MPSTLVTKLRLHTAQTACILRAPAGYLQLLEPLPAGLRIDTEPAGQYDFLQAFYTLRTELTTELPDLLQAARQESLLWLCYPKPGKGIPSDLNRDILASVVESHSEWRCIAQVAIDDTWSALRARPKALIGR